MIPVISKVKCVLLEKVRLHCRLFKKPDFTATGGSAEKNHRNNRQPCPHHIQGATLINWVASELHRPTDVEPRPTDRGYACKQ